MKRLMLLLTILLLVLGLGTITCAEGNPSSKGITVNPNTSTVSVWSDRSEYMVGDPVNISFKSDVDGYAALFDGRNNMLWPQEGNNGLISAGRVYTLPAFNASEPARTENIVLVVFKRASLSIWDLLPSLTLKPQTVQTDAKVSASCAFNVIPRIQKTTVRISGASGARIFVDGQEYGTAPLTIQLEVGRHQLVALMPGMVAQVKQITPKQSQVPFIDWQLSFEPVQ